MTDSVNTLSSEDIEEALDDNQFDVIPEENKHLLGSFGLGVLRGLQRKPIYSGHIYDPNRKARLAQQKASRKANR